MRRLAFIGVFVLALLPGIASAALVGDARGDGTIDSLDATIILQVDAGLVPLENLFVAPAKLDVNGDGAINSIDATLILQHSARLICLNIPPKDAGTTCLR